MTYQPYLVQRIMRRDRPHKTGIDSKFEFDYMGSSEFEWGALSLALREMRAALKEDWKPRAIEVGTFKAWYVGPRNDWNEAISLFHDQLRYDSQFRLQERTGIRDSFIDPEKWTSVFDGWWCIDAGHPFAFFKEEKNAELWLEHLHNPPPQPPLEEEKAR